MGQQLSATKANKISDDNQLSSILKSIEKRANIGSNKFVHYGAYSGKLSAKTIESLTNLEYSINTDKDDKTVISW